MRLLVAAVTILALGAQPALAVECDRIAEGAGASANLAAVLMKSRSLDVQAAMDIKADIEKSVVWLMRGRCGIPQEVSEGLSYLQNYIASNGKTVPE